MFGLVLEPAVLDMFGLVLEPALMKTKMELMEPLHALSLGEEMNRQVTMVSLAPVVRYSPVAFPVPAAKKQKMVVQLPPDLLVVQHLAIQHVDAHLDLPRWIFE